MIYPNTIPKYVNCPEYTPPGTDIKVTPDNEAPIIPYATTNQGDFLLPVKNVLLLDFLDVK